MNKVFQVEVVQKTFIHDSTTGPSFIVNVPLVVAGPRGEPGIPGQPGEPGKAEIPAILDGGNF